MEGAIILKAILALIVGSILLWVGWNNWKYRDTDAVPWIEVKILDLTDQEPRPRAAFDKISRRIQAGLGLVLGSFFAGVGLLMLFGFGEIE